MNEFREKCVQKDMDPSEFPKILEDRMIKYQSQWEKTLSEQIHKLPEFETVEREVLRQFRMIDFSDR